MTYNLLFMKICDKNFQFLHKTFTIRGMITKLISKGFLTFFKLDVTAPYFQVNRNPVKLPFVGPDIGLMTLLSFDHVMLHRATVEDKATSWKVLFPSLKCLKLFRFRSQKGPNAVCSNTAGYKICLN